MKLDHFSPTRSVTRQTDDYVQRLLSEIERRERMSFGGAAAARDNEQSLRNARARLRAATEDCVS